MAANNKNNNSSNDDSRWLSPYSFLVLCALIALALNLRSPITAAPPIIGEIRHDLGIDATAAGLLTGIPLLCFGLLTPLASMFIKKTGIYVALFTTLIGASIGLVLRPYTGTFGLFGGTFLIGISLAIGNIVSFMIIARDFSRQMSMVTGIYTASLNIGTLLTGAFTAPIAAVTDWHFALAFWVLMAIAALILWVIVARKDETKGKDVATAATRKPTISKDIPKAWKRPIIYWLSLAFVAHIFLYYAITAWLPAYLIDVDHMTPTNAGFIASSFQILSLLGSFGVPLMTRYISLSKQLILMGIIWAITPILILLIPQQWYIWAVIGGFTQGGTFVVIFMLVMKHAYNLDDNRVLSSIVQGIGYALSSVGPVIIGSIHDTTHSWTPAFIILAFSALAIIAAGIFATKIPLPKTENA